MKMRRHRDDAIERIAAPVSRNVRLLRNDRELRDALARAGAFDQRAADVVRAREHRYQLLLASPRTSREPAGAIPDDSDRPTTAGIP